MTKFPSDEIAIAVEARLPFAETLFETLAVATRDGDGVTRQGWSTADSCAASMVSDAADALGLEVAHDSAGNIYATLPGKDRNAPALLTGSHLDSVPKGGNYDGFAGTVAGLTALAAYRDLGLTPPCDIRAVGLRGEESVWYGIAYIGSRLAVGSLDITEIDRLRRADTDRTLAEHMTEVGVDITALRGATAPFISSKNTKGFLELHIEQGPVLVDRNIPVCVPTVIRGNARFPFARCFGEYAHSAAVPRELRRDAALAVVDLVGELDRLWQAYEANGEPDTVFTVGQLYTNADQHAMTKVPGECAFSLNFGGTTEAFLDVVRDKTITLAGEIGERRNVDFQLGECVGSNPTPLDSGLRRQLGAMATDLGIPMHEMATVGHDASIFARAGIPSAMVLIRNQHGSHNAAEAMEMADFGLGTQILAATLLDLA
jgi:N-carbamoyl-L-amino-acid hydrolase